MRKGFGISLIVLGTALLVGALSLLGYNLWEDRQAGEAVAAVMPQLLEQVAPAGTHPAETPELSEPETPTLPQMREVEVDGVLYVGYVTVPELELALPVASQWSYSQLLDTPCRYYGSIWSDDLVLLGHNYSRHFGPIRDLAPGTEVQFTDMDGNTVHYKVVATEVLLPTAVENVTAGEYDLVLFTCTYGGRYRSVTYCDRAI